MTNFLNFIEEDIEAKQMLLSTMPTNTKPNIKKYNEKIKDFTEKYNTYKDSVKKYLDIKSKSFEIKADKKAIEEANELVSNLENAKFFLNPTNTYLEKMGFDNLLFQISNYYAFGFSSLNDIINGFLDQFSLAGIVLSANDFDYTCYVNEYMTAFLEVRTSGSNSYSRVAEIFEKIYWVNSEIIEHIELNFRKLIRKNEKKFNEYISAQAKLISGNQIIDYEDCLNKLKDAYNNLNNAEKENISDIIELSKNNTIDMNNYFEDAKNRVTTYSELIIDQIGPDDTRAMNNFYENLDKLSFNLKEYSSYIKFLPLIDDFKAEYGKSLEKKEPEQSVSKAPSNNKNKDNKEKDILSKIIEQEAALEKINKTILGGNTTSRFGLKQATPANNINQLKVESVKKAKDLYELYKEFDNKYFVDKVVSTLNDYSTISELLHLYNSFDYFKKTALKKVFIITDYKKIIELSDEFDLFAKNLTNVIVTGIYLSEEKNIARIISNKYRLSNINITEEILSPEKVDIFIDKIKLPLRVNVIEQSKTTVEKIWFMVFVSKIDAAQKKEDEQKQQVKAQEEEII